MKTHRVNGLHFLPPMLYAYSSGHLQAVLSQTQNVQARTSIVYKTLTKRNEKAWLNRNYDEEINIQLSICVFVQHSNEKQ